MPSKIYAISNPSAAIALRYGVNVSRGIVEMESRLEEYRDYLQGRIGKDTKGVKKK
jgi:hypothetical protein